MNTPKIRFKGFEDDWEQRKLKDMCSIITKQTGFDYTTTIKPSLVTKKEEDTYSFIQNKDFEGMNINLDTDFYIPISVAERYPKITLDQPSLLISISGRIGNVGLYSLQSKAFIGGAVGICKLNNIEDGKTVLYELLSPFGQKYFSSLVKASSHANITVEDIRNIEVLLPKSVKEERRINIFFEKLDHLITLHQRKCDETKQLKKFMLQKMFPKNGEKNPELRFEGFMDDWEQRKLGDIASSFEYGLNAAAKEYDGENKYIRITDIDDNTHEFLTDSLTSPDIDLTGADNYKLIEGDILFARTGASVGKSYIYRNSDGLVYYAGFLIRARIKEECDAEFVFQNTLTDRYNKYIAVTSQRSGQPGVNAQEYAEFEIKVPKKEEQTKIGTYFRNLDHLITLHQRKCEKLKELKNFMLQNMFV